MNFTTRLRTSWALLRRSIDVLRESPRLMLFPLVSTVAVGGLALCFFAPVIWFVFNRGSEWLETWGAVGGRLDQMSADKWKEALQGVHGIVYAYGGVIYLVSLFLATFCNVAFYNEIMRALAGEAVSLRRGWAFASSRWAAILKWSLLAGTVGLLIRAIEDRLGWLGKIVTAFIGTAWSVAAVFAIPVLIRREDNNPVGVLRDSAATLKKSWGESLAGFVGLQLGGTMLTLLIAAGGIGLAIIAAKARLMGIALSICAVWVLAIVVLGFFVTMATHVYRCALYVYASEGVVPGPYTAELMDAGWKIKQG